MAARASDVLAIARRSVLIALGGTIVLAEGSGRLLARAAATGEKYLRVARGWRMPVIAFGRLERKR